MGISAPKIIFRFGLRGTWISGRCRRRAGRIRLGIAAPGEVRRLVDDLAHLGVDGLQLLFADFCREQTIAGPVRSGPALVAPSRPLHVSVFCRIRHRVAAIAVSLHFQDVVSFARHQATASSPAAFTARMSMPSTCSPGHRRRCRAWRNRSGGRMCHRSAHGVAVVLDDVDHSGNFQSSAMLSFHRPGPSWSAPSPK